MGGCFPMLFLLRLVIKINTLPMTDLCGVYLFQSFAWYDVQDPRLIERAANCRIRACDWKAAALLLRDRAIPKQFAEAAKCFEHCGSWSDAAAAWALVPNGLGQGAGGLLQGEGLGIWGHADQVEPTAKPGLGRFQPQQRRWAGCRPASSSA